MNLDLNESLILCSDITLLEYSFMLEQRVADHAGEGFNSYTVWMDEIDTIPTWQFWRSV